MNGPPCRPLEPDARPAHRDDIEGLRGIAVLSVFAVHSIPDSLAGGFIGVDVFFVLSGFLIAAITLREVDAGRFSVAGFYRRRLRRLLPALLLVLAACMVFAVTLALPADARLIGKHVLAGATFVSNIVLWTEGGYFDPSSELKPLLHLWSLGIEEQFYLLWPLFVLVAARARRWLLSLVSAALIASFLLNVLFVATKAKAVFYLPGTRFWEMLAGVLLAAWEHRVHGGLVTSLRQRLPEGSAWRGRVPDVLAAAGVLLLLAAMGLIKKTDHFPGWWALLPTSATVLLLAAGTRAWVNRVLLAQPALMFYGRISYPLYLWHWPLLTFPVLMNIPLDAWAQAALLVAAVLLAALTTWRVEQPLRHGPCAQRALPWQAGALVLLGALGGALFVGDGLVEHYPAPVRAIAREHLRQDPAAIRLGSCFQTSAALRRAHADDCIDAEPAAAPLALLWGDSFAAAIYPGLRAVADSGALPMRLAQFTGPLCPPLLQASPRQLQDCEAMNGVALEQITRHRPALVVLAGAWLHYQGKALEHAADMEGLGSTIRRLKALGVPRVVVLGSPPVWRAAQPRLLISAWRSTGELPQRTSEGLVAEAVTADARVEDVVRRSGGEFISPMALLCDAGGCLTTVEQGGLRYPLAHDEAHLTQPGARRLVELMLPQLSKAAADAR